MSRFLGFAVAVAVAVVAGDGLPADDDPASRQERPAVRGSRQTIGRRYLRSLLRVSKLLASYADRDLRPIEAAGTAAAAGDNESLCFHAHLL